MGAAWRGGGAGGARGACLSDRGWWTRCVLRKVAQADSRFLSLALGDPSVLGRRATTRSWRRRPAAGKNSRSGTAWRRTQRGTTSRCVEGGEEGQRVGAPGGRGSRDCEGACGTLQLFLPFFFIQRSSNRGCVRCSEGQSCPWFALRTCFLSLLFPSSCSSTATTSGTLRAGGPTWCSRPLTRCAPRP